MKFEVKKLATAFVASFVFLSGAYAEDKPTADREPTNDKEFVAKAIACEVAEIKMAELAKKQTKNPDVVKFADAIITDHTKMRDSLMERAKVMKLAVVEGTEKAHREKAETLAKLTGPEFDRAYMKCMTDGHEMAIKAYETWSKKATDTDLGELVKKAIPSLKEHKKHAEELATKVK